MKKKFWNERTKEILLGIAGILTYFLINIFMGDILRLFGFNTNNLSDKKIIIIDSVFGTFILMILILIFMKILKNNWKDYKTNWKSLLKRNFKYWFCALAIMFASNLAISLIFNRVTSTNEEGVRELFDVLPSLIIYRTILLAPFTEELVFRQSFRCMIKNKYLFIAIAGIVFGLMHVLTATTWVEFLYIIPYSAPGLFFAYMLYKEDNVLVPISYHLIHNTLALILMIIGKMITM